MCAFLQFGTVGFGFGLLVFRSVFGVVGFRIPSCKLWIFRVLWLQNSGFGAVLRLYLKHVVIRIGGL